MIATEPFGRSGHQSSRVIFGAAALANVSQEEADKTLSRLFEFGINHIDTAASYGDSERRLGPWMEKHRDKFFLATKTEARTSASAWKELQRSLRRLRVDRVDLWQMHLLVDPHDWEIAMGPGGALEAFIEARDKGLTRYLGVTGHGLGVAAMHMRSLGRFDFDSILLPYNPVIMRNPAYASDFDTLYAHCLERRVAIQTIKAIARGPWKEGLQNRSTWYEPLEDQAEIDLAVRFVLGRSGLFLNSVADINLLPQVLDAAGRSDQIEAPVDVAEAVERLHMEPLFS